VLLALKEGEGVRDVMLEAERAENILSYLNRFEYASRKHLVFSLLWKTAMRTGALHSLDVCDLDEDRGALRLRHRPDTGTSLKNGNEGERLVAITDTTCCFVSDWIEFNKPDVTNEYGRQPLVATEHGRITKGNIRDVVYRITRYCSTQKGCPCGNKSQHPSKCEASVSPHALRRGSITHHLKQDIPETVVSDRADVSPSILSKHYDRMTQEEKMEQRRDYLDSM
jgi:integrase